MATAKNRNNQVAGGKGGSSKPKQPSIASNSTASLSTVKIVYLWSWGPIVGPVNGLRSIKLDGTPIVADDGTVNYPSVKWQFRNGELNQDRLEGLAESSNEISVGQTLLSTSPYLYTVNTPLVDAVRVRLSWPNLQRQDSSGNVTGLRIDYAIDVSTNGGPFVTALESFVDRKNVTTYYRSHRIDLPDGNNWTIRVRRLTPEANSSLVQDTMVVTAIAEVIDSDLEYPLTAVGLLEYDAQTFDGNFAKISARMRGRIVRVPANYNPETRTYSNSGTGTTGGVWDGTFKEAYTNNPAWVYYDLVLNPYFGLGNRIDSTMVDKWALYRVAQYCDQLVPDGSGGFEPRFACNVYLQKQADAYAVMQDIASIFRGMSYWDGSQIVVTADMPSDPVFSYSPSQILNDGAIKYAGTRARDRHSLAVVSWDNPDLGFETDKEPIFDDEAIGEIGVRELQVAAFGCTSLGQAQRAGSWALLSEQLQTRSAVFQVGLDGGAPKPGQVIAVADHMLAGRANGGRVSAVSGRAITLDRDIEVPSNARLFLNLPSGRSEARAVVSVSGRTVTVASDYSEIPIPELGWALDYDDLAVMQFQVKNVSRPDWHVYEIEAIQHEPGKYAAIDTGAKIDERPISVLPAGVQEAPASVVISQHVVIEQGIAVTVMTIGWDVAPGAVAYDVEWRWGSSEWVKIPRTGEQVADVRGIYSGQYLARVRAVSAQGVQSLPTSSVLTTLEGKTSPPPVLAFLNTTSIVFGIKLDWGFPAGSSDALLTEIRYGTTNDLSLAQSLGTHAYPTATTTLQGLSAGRNLFFWGRLIDKSGNVGEWLGPIMGTSSADADEILDYLTGQITETELGSYLTSEIDKISGIGPGSVNQRIGELQNIVDAQLESIEAQLTDITGAPEWDVGVAYLEGQMVKFDGGLYRASQDVPAGTPVSDAAYWEKIGDYDSIGELVSALAARMATVETDVDELTGTVTAQSQSITALSSSVATAIDDAGAAQQAAQDAATLAGSKGKVIVQSSAPATADRQAQNLWIDTTNNANTPKRWNGSAWVAVTDKVATDAAAAAAQALSGLGSKADASALQNLSTTVTQQGNTLTSQGQSITALTNRVSGAESGVAGNASAIQSLESEVGMIDGRVTATASSIDALSAQARPVRADGEKADALRGWQNQASYAQLVKVQATDTEASVTRDTQLTASVGDVNSRLTIEEQTRATVDAALASRTETIEARMPAGSGTLGTEAAIQDETTARANADSALANRTTTLEARMPAGSGQLATDAAVQNVQQALATATNALAQDITQVEASVGQAQQTADNAATAAGNAQNAAQTASDLAGGKGKVLFQSSAPAVADRLPQNLWIDTTGNANTPKRWNGSAWVAATDKVATDAATAASNAQSTASAASAAVQVVAQAQADLEDGLSTMWAVKMQVNSNGQYVYAGVGLGIENVAGNLQSSFIIRADQFAILNNQPNGTVTSPFIVSGGVTYIAAAMIRDGTITDAKIGNVIQSTNYVAGQTGWRLDKNGSFEINSSIPGGGRLIINPNGLYIYDGINPLPRLEAGLLL